MILNIDFQVQLTREEITLTMSVYKLSFSSMKVGDERYRIVYVS